MMIMERQRCKALGRPRSVGYLPRSDDFLTRTPALWSPEFFAGFFKRIRPRYARGAHAHGHARPTVASSR